MVKLNLLPAYILEAQKVRKLILLFSVLLAVELAGLVGWVVLKKQQLGKVSAALEEMTQKADEVRNLESQAQRLDSEISPLRQKVQFMEELETFNSTWADAIEQLAAYTYSRVEWLQLEIKGNTVSFQARLKDTEERPATEDVARFLMNFKRCPLIDPASVQHSGIDGWPPGRGGGAAGGIGGMGGMMLGSMGGMGMGEMEMEGAMGMEAGPMMGGGEMMPYGGMEGGMGSPMGMGPMGPGMGGTTGATAPRETARYVTLTVSARLRKPITPPKLGGAAPAAAAPSMGMGMGAGMMPGMAPMGGAAPGMGAGMGGMGATAGEGEEPVMMPGAGAMSPANPMSVQ